MINKFVTNKNDILNINTLLHSNNQRFNLVG